MQAQVACCGAPKRMTGQANELIGSQPEAERTSISSLLCLPAVLTATASASQSRQWSMRFASQTVHRASPLLLVAGQGAAQPQLCLHDPDLCKLDAEGRGKGNTSTCSKALCICLTPAQLWRSRTCGAAVDATSCFGQLPCFVQVSSGWPPCLQHAPVHASHQAATHLRLSAPPQPPAVITQHIFNPATQHLVSTVYG